MGFQGQLSSVNLTDIFQTLNMNRQTGTLSITGPVTTVHVYFDQGNITMCSAPLVNGRPYALDMLSHKGQLSNDKLDDLVRQQQAGGHSLRELILASGMVADYELDEICASAVEELVCPVFEWQEGDFTFTDGGPVAELQGPEAVILGSVVVQTTQLVMEATRRMDEWKRIRAVITDADAFFIVDNEGRTNLKNVQTDPDMLKVLRYLDGRHGLDAIAVAVGVTRFDTFAIVAQLVLGGVARARSAQEVVEDAVTLIGQGDLKQAHGLLEACLKQSPVPEVMRPLAECCVKLGQAPRAVELYLELIQLGQDQGDLAASLKDLDTVIDLSPDDPDLHFERGQVQSELGQVEPAALSFSTAAQAYLSRKDLPRAIDACHRAKNLLPRAPEPHRYLARAYLLEGQTENAVVEYKSLWHALLTAERPKAALETLKGILEQDCKYTNVREQVLSHAQNSEAIKTSKAMRYLVYALIVLLMLAGGAAGWEWYQQHVVRHKADDSVVKLESELATRELSLQHPDILKDIDDLNNAYGTIPEIHNHLEQLQIAVQADYNARASAVLAKAQSLTGEGRFNDALAAIEELKQRYVGTTAVTLADQLLDQVHGDMVRTEVEEKERQAKALWENLDWSQALSTIEVALQRKDLPGQLRDQLEAEHAAWVQDSHSAAKLYARAQRIEANGSQQDALNAYRLASQGEGQVDLARTRVLALELDIAHALGHDAQMAAQRNDDQQAFANIDKLETLAKQASSQEVGAYLAALELPYALVLDDTHDVLVVKHPDGEESHVAAPPGSRGGWSHQISYRVGETVVVDISRLGFATQSLTIAVQNRRTQSIVALARGARWRIDLSGVPTTRPVMAGQLALIGTDKATIEIVDPVTGANQPWHLPNGVANLTEFLIPPVVFQQHAIAVIAEHIFDIDLSSRNTDWAYPPVATGNGVRFNGFLCAQDHEIIAGSLLVVAPVVKGGTQLLEVDGQGQITEYPRLEPQADVTGGPLIDHVNGKTLLYLPTASGLAVYEMTSVTKDTPPNFLYLIQSKGDLIGTPVRTTVTGRDAVLVADRTGSILAIDCDPNTGGRTLKAWVLNGTDPTSPVLAPRLGVAFVGVSPGRVYAIDLQRTGQSLWEYPLQGQPNLGELAGCPAVGRNGVYCADAHGTLHCLDLRTGSEHWHAELGSPAAGGVIVQDGRILVGLKTGQMVCFEEGDD